MVGDSWLQVGSYVAIERGLTRSYLVKEEIWHLHALKQCLVFHVWIMHRPHQSRARSIWKLPCLSLRQIIIALSLFIDCNTLNDL